MEMKNCLEINATVVANEFIDRHMASANGEYVKVYLYLLRHQGEDWNIGMIADALNHTESDVKRALGYWVRQGVLAETGYQAAGPGSGAGASAGPEAGNTSGSGAAPGGGPGIVSGAKGRRGAAADGMPPQGNLPEAGIWMGFGGAAGAGETGLAGPESGAGLAGTAVLGEGMGTSGLPGAGGSAGTGAVGAPGSGSSVGAAGAPGSGSGVGAAEAPGLGRGAAGTAAGERRKMYTPEQVSRLADQEDFTQLLYISQKYMNKVFTPRECEVFAYLYDGLRMSAELLEYLVEYCVQGGHTSIRYLESVALNWHEKGIRTVDMAKEYTATFSKEGFAVMKAFGISDRRPGDSEQAMIRKWFREYGFTRDIVLEACGRTLKAIHKPSFSYADKILSDWKKGGVRVLADVAKLDEKRENRKNDRSTGAVKPAKNQFHNFEQRSTNYDAMVLERLKERLEDKK